MLTLLHFCNTKLILHACCLLSDIALCCSNGCELVGLRQAADHSWYLAFVGEVLGITEPLVPCGILRLFVVYAWRHRSVMCVFVNKYQLPGTSVRSLRCRINNHIQYDGMTLHSLLCLPLYNLLNFINITSFSL